MSCTPTSKALETGNLQVLTNYSITLRKEKYYEFSITENNLAQLT